AFLGRMKEDLPGAEVALLDDTAEIVVDGGDRSARDRGGEVGEVWLVVESDRSAHHVTNFGDRHCRRNAVQDVLGQRRRTCDECVELGFCLNGWEWCYMWLTAGRAAQGSWLLATEQRALGARWHGRLRRGIGL